MQFNILEAKNLLPILVKAVIQGEKVIIASNDQTLVRLVPCRSSEGLSHWGILTGQTVADDAAFSPQVDDEVSKLFGEL